VCGTGDWYAVEGSRDECCALCVVQETGMLLKAHVTSVVRCVVQETGVLLKAHVTSVRNVMVRCVWYRRLVCC